MLDGSWGVLIQSQVRGEEAYRGERFKDHPRDVAGDPDLLNLTRPDVIARIHDEYFAAGADIATTNTFTATTIGQSDYALEDAVYEMNLEGARIARRAADEWSAREPHRPRFVAGAVGPLNVTLSLSPRVDDPAYRAVTFDAVRDTYAHQLRALRDGGVDLFLVETVFDSLNAKAAIVAALDVAPEIPLWLSFTAVDKSGRNLSGQTAEAFWISVEHAQPLVVGVNCSLGAADMRPFVEDLARHATTWVSCYPNAGLPNEFGGYDEQPHDTAVCSASLHATVSSTSSGAVAARLPTTYAPSSPPSKASRRGTCRSRSPARFSAASSLSRSRPTRTSSWSASARTSPARRASGA